MMRRIKKMSKWALVVGLVLSSTNLLQAADTDWSGDISGLTATLAAGEDLNIRDNCQIVTANARIDATGTGNHDVNLSGSYSISSTAGYSLIINVASGATLTFLLSSSDLSFVGGSGANIFKIYQIGAGQVYFKLKGGRILRFKGDPDDDTTGTYYFCRMDHKDIADRVGVFFEYYQSDDTTDNQNAVISLEDASMFTFSAQARIATSTEEGGIGIIPAVGNTYAGSLMLNIQCRAGFVLTGHYSEAITTVDLATLAGHQVNMLIMNSTSADKQRFLVVNGNEMLSQLFCDPTRTRETVTGVQHGFILGPNSELRLENGTYLDYVGTTTNTDPLISASNVLQGRNPSSILKQRNASALTVDGYDLTGSQTVRIVMEDQSGIFLRSACDSSGTWTYACCGLTDAGLIFTITPTWQPAGAGNIVFDIEAALDVLGKADATASHVNTINILSREVTQTGGKLEMEGTLLTFPAFTFATDSNDGDTFAQYAKACAFVNAHVNMNGVLLRHDDFVHTVNSTNTPTVSQPTYIGGDTFVLTYSSNRPTINLFNSELRLHTSAAFTGVDLQTTTTVVSTECTSTIRFYGNGRQLDRGTGRALVLGTTSGSYAYDDATVVDASSYLDIFQKYNTGSADIDLQLTVTHNDHNWISQIPVGANYATQYSIHTIFLGNASDIQVGSQSTQTGVTFEANPRLYINGNFFSFMSQGGSIGQPELSATTGEGGIFVDQRGVLTLSDTSRANFGCMVVRGSPTASVSLPKSKAFFADRVGISYWDLDLSQTQTVISSTLSAIADSWSDFTLDWMATKKDYANGFIPFDPTGDLVGTLDHHTLFHIPVVTGGVDEFQVKRSRLGDQVHLLVDGGLIRNLVFLKGFDSSEAQTGLVVVQNDGQVGLGDNSTRRDTLESNIVLGINGVTIAAQGNGIYNLNTDVTINNVCPIIAGPDFARTTTQTLYIRSDDPHFIRVKTGGTLDLSSFTSTMHQIVLDGKVQLIFEPNSRIILSRTGTGGTMFFTGQSECTFEPVIDRGMTEGSTVASTNDFRAKIIGSGAIKFQGDSSCRIYKDAYVGIETGGTCDTNLLIELDDNAKMYVGDSAVAGGALQIGDTSSGYSTTITTTFKINGPKALLEIGSQGFLGLGVGIVDKRQTVPNNWYVGPLYGLHSFTLTVSQGTLRHDRIALGSSSQASLLAFGDTAGTTRVDGDVLGTSNVNIFGGGNMYRWTSGDGVKVNPSVVSTASTKIGILGSGYLLIDKNNIRTDIDTSPLREFASHHNFETLFNLLCTKSVQTTKDQVAEKMSFGKANLTRMPGSDYLGYRVNDTLKRSPISTIYSCATSGGGSYPVPHDYALSVGAVEIAWGTNPVRPVTANPDHVSELIYDQREVA